MIVTNLDNYPFKENNFYLKDGMCYCQIFAQARHFAVSL